MGDEIAPQSLSIETGFGLSAVGDSTGFPPRVFWSVTGSRSTRQQVKQVGRRLPAANVFAALRGRAASALFRVELPEITRRARRTFNELAGNRTLRLEPG